MLSKFKKVSQIALLLFVFAMMLPNLKAQPIGSKIRIGADSTISYWNGTAWIAVAPGLPGQSLQFSNGYNANYSTIPNDGLVAYYPFNGNASDMSGNGHDGIVQGATLYTDRFGNANSAFSFDGNGHNIITNINSLLLTDVSLSLWIKESPGNSGRPFGYENASDGGCGLGLYYPTINNPKLIMRGGGEYDMMWGTINSKIWYHYVITISSANGTTLYLNGQQVNNNPNAKSFYSCGIPLTFGSAGASGQFFNGAIDDIRIYNRKLTDTEIQSIYHENGWPNSVAWVGNPNPVTDIDGNMYDIVKIGTQYWMKQTLNVTHYSNGDAIPNVTDNTAWSNLTTGAYCNYNNDANNAATYGRLYNFYTVVDTRNLCPTGWHVPSDIEWTTLTNYLGGDGIAGGKLKETGLTHWNSPNIEATNETGFAALPGGYRNFDGIYNTFGYNSGWWSSTENGVPDAWSRGIASNYGGVYRGYGSKSYGFSVRCLKD